MTTKKKSVNYVIGLPEWQESATSDVNRALMNRLKLVKKLGLKGYESIRWGAGGVVQDSKMVVLHLNNYFWFKTKVTWQKACKVLDMDKRYFYEPFGGSEDQRLRIYKLVNPAKVRVDR